MKSVKQLKIAKEYVDVVRQTYTNDSEEEMSIRVGHTEYVLRPKESLRMWAFADGRESVSVKQTASNSEHQGS